MTIKQATTNGTNTKYPHTDCKVGKTKVDIKLVVHCAKLPIAITAGLVGLSHNSENKIVTQKYVQTITCNHILPDAIKYGTDPRPNSNDIVYANMVATLANGNQFA